MRVQYCCGVVFLGSGTSPLEISIHTRAYDSQASGSLEAAKTTFDKLC